MRRRLKELDGIRIQMEVAPDGQVALTDPDARCMASRGRDTPMVGYNVQTAVDAQHHLIVAHEVTNVGNDRNQLAPMAQKARAEMGCDPASTFTALADRGYYNGDQILECAQAGITALVPKSLTSNNRAKGLFDKRDFRYQPESDTFRCPAGQTAIRRFETIEHDRKMIKYWSSACPRCPIKSSCTTGEYRRITRWEHEDVLDAMQQRMDDTPDAMRVRRRTVEHPYATIKSWMGATHLGSTPFSRTVWKVDSIGRKDKELVLLAGLWETKKNEDGSDHRSFTMLTINAEGHPIMGRMHASGEEKRSAVPVEQPDWVVWLAPENHEELRGLLKLFDAELYETWPKPKVPRKSALKE